MLVLGGLFHRVIAGDFLMSQLEGLNAQMPGPGMVLIFILPVSLIMAYMFPKGYQGGSLVGEGFRFGALIGIVMVLPLNVLMGSMFGAKMGAALVDIPWHVFEEGMVGVAIAMVYGKAKKKRASGPAAFST